MAVLPATAGRVLLLDLRTGRFHQRSQVGHSDAVEPLPVLAAGSPEEAAVLPRDVLDVAARSRRPAWWAQTAKSAPSIWHEPRSTHRLVHPVVRDGTVVVLLDIEGSQPLDVAALGVAAELLNQVFIKIYERRSTLRLLYELQQPVAPNHDRALFYGELATLISKASGMEFVAIREHNKTDDRLVCVAATGLGVERGEFSKLDLSELGQVTSFRAALLGQTVAEPTTIAAHLAWMREMPHLKDVRCFVALPIIVGDDTIGVLSVAARCTYAFSRMELRGFETIANSIGVAIANFKNLHTNADQVRRLAKASAETLGQVLAQAARHEAKRYLDNAQKRLTLVARWLSGKGGVDKDPSEVIKLASADLKRARDSLDKMRTNALISPGQTTVRADVRQLVLDAADQVFGELEDLEITFSAPPAGVFVQVIPEPVQLAFLHLLQNSVNAFHSSKAKKRGRSIDVTVAAAQAGQRAVRIVYADNATGIDITRLTIPDELQQMPWSEAVFERGVTGSSDGTGFGLYLVRTLLAQAGGGTPGTVELVEYRNRVVFAIGLPVAD
jgi:signal transduction histidine kinase